SSRSRFLWIGAAATAVLAVVVLWAVPRLQPATGTLVVIAAGRQATTLPARDLMLGQGGSWSAVGSVSGSVPAAPEQRELLTASVPAGRYDGVRVGGESQPITVTITAGQVEPLLLGMGAGQLLPGGVYAANDVGNLGLGEACGRFGAMARFDVVG